MSPSLRVLSLSTMAFTLLFAVWLMFGILGGPVRRELGLSQSAIYWLGAAAVLSGSLFRLPFGILADRLGGKLMLTVLLLWTAIPCAMVSFTHSYAGLVACALLFGLAGNSFSVGIAWNSAWFSKETQGTALGTFGAGNVGAAVTKLFGPAIIALMPAAGLLSGIIPGGWRAIPVFYAVLLVVMAALVWFLAPRTDRRPGQGRPLLQMLAPLAEMRVWRFGLYYILVFGAYVAMSMWLPMYYQQVYGLSLATAGLLTALFIFPASLLRPLGGWMADRYGARPVTYAVFIAILGLSALLAGNGVGDYLLSVPMFTLLVVLIGVAMGVGKASVYRYIPDYFPKDVGAVGGMVGTLGALGGFVMLPLMGAIEDHAHYRASAFGLLVVIASISLAWLHLVVRRQESQRPAPELSTAAA